MGTDSTARPLLAYTVSEPGEGRGVVVFATGGAAARRKGAGELELTFQEVDSCCRSPEFDRYAPGPVPPLVMIDHGWWFECCHCGHHIDIYAVDPDGDELDPVADGQSVYCSKAHMMAEWAERRERQARDDAAVEACAIQFHGLPISNLRGVRGGHHYKAGGRDTVACCEFDFPGRTGMLARWDVGGDTVFVSRCDVDVWNALFTAAKREV